MAFSLHKKGGEWLLVDVSKKASAPPVKKFKSAKAGLAFVKRKYPLSYYFGVRDPGQKEWSYHIRT